MGTTDSGLFADDLAADVREVYLSELASGSEPPAATETVLTEFGQELSDADDGPIVWLALAATQWEYGYSDPDVIARALAVIHSGQDLARWHGSALAGQRRRVLAALERRLQSPPPPSKRPRRRQVPMPPGIDVPSPDGSAVASAFELEPSRAQVYVEMEVGANRGGGHVAIVDAPLGSLALSWLDADTLEVSYPEGTALTDAKECAYYSGRSIAVRYRDT